ncbi:8-oxo-dGTP pyrophosphatase MutT (NUDIX family) [Planomicrobium stackebrandtii]|uniref:8-oxo-dGTP pyrophosphatase MutT (NUDIX family) n=1 Tax=Planomicrobium stackebrandtii TaxID=253160 RepID=A0ABU0GZ67_9BACL|nr:NUDIX domain-containing protein [Planomicrobium stackebrandtii]MDQ0430603.1 8-oxo-dGTP pyrophosphatase MutT (NUDIX family) [Planomicrobium stackebrandtii]
MRTKRKVFAYITRGEEENRELLVFEYKGEPEVGLQVPGGTIEDDELLIDALYREVKEETGLPREVIDFVGKIHKYTYYPEHQDKAYERNIFHFEYTGDPIEQFEHTIASQGRDNGLTLLFRWEPIKNLPQLAEEQDTAIELL